MTGTYRVTINGFQCRRETWDDPWQSDGKRDEVFCSVNTKVVGRDGTVKRELNSTSETMGDTWNQAGRVQAGSASNRGGIRTNDKFPDKERPWERSDALDGHRYPPYVIWEGQLVEGGDMVMVTPTIWEWDPGTSVLEALANWHVQTDQKYGQRAKEIFSKIWPVAEPVFDAVSLGIQTVGTLSGQWALMGHQASRPIGMQRDPADPAGCVFNSTTFALSSETAEKLVNANDQGLGPGITELEFKDDEQLAGHYSMFLQFEKIGGPSPHAAAFVSQSVPATMVPGQTYDATVTMRNLGTETWTTGARFLLGAQNPHDNNTWGPSRVDVPAPIAPGQDATFRLRATAPTTPGTHNFQWRMLQEGVEWFGEPTPNIAVQVQPQAHAAAFVSQSVPATMVPGQTYDATVTMRNLGTETWTIGARFLLGAQNPHDNNTWGPSRVDVPAPIAPGQDATFRLRATAPTTPGTHNFQWRMLQEGVEWFGEPTPNIAVQVQPQAHAAAFVSQSVPATMVPGQTYDATVTMRNLGTETWTTGARFLLGAQNPHDNNTWGPSRVDVPAPIAPGQDATFRLRATAPTTPGTHNFQWRMLQEGVEVVGR